MGTRSSWQPCPHVNPNHGSLLAKPAGQPTDSFVFLLPPTTEVLQPSLVTSQGYGTTWPSDEGIIGSLKLEKSSKTMQSNPIPSHHASWDPTWISCNTEPLFSSLCPQTSVCCSLQPCLGFFLPPASGSGAVTKIKRRKHPQLITSSKEHRHFVRRRLLVLSCT